MLDRLSTPRRHPFSHCLRSLLDPPSRANRSGRPAWPGELHQSRVAIVAIDSATVGSYDSRAWYIHIFKAHLPPETTADVPAEFVSVTETVPITLVSPLKVNGTASENAPPFVTPVALANHVAESLPNGTAQLGVHPFNWAPEVAVKTNAPLVRSRGVELASRTT